MKRLSYTTEFALESKMVQYNVSLSKNSVSQITTEVNRLLKFTKNLKADVENLKHFKTMKDPLEKAALVFKIVAKTVFVLLGSIIVLTINQIMNFMKNKYFLNKEGV